MSPICVRKMTLRRLNAGFTLIELMVALVIGLALTLVITRMLANQEGVRRGVTSGNDLSGNMAYASYSLERELSTAGAGFSQMVPANYGCVLNVSKSAAQLLPSTANFPAPFAAIPRTYRLAPVVVHAGAGTGGSDVIAVAAGASGLGENAQDVVPRSTAAGQLRLANTLGIRAGDLALVAQAGVGGGCMLQQVAAGFVASTAGAPQPVLSFGGDYAADTINGLALTGLSNGNAYVSVLGNVIGNQPRIQLIGIGADATLFSYDLLRLNQTTPQALMEGVADLRVRYGVNLAAPGVRPRNVTAWVAPTTAGYTATALNAGTPVAQAALQTIVALRVGLVLRSELIEKDAVSAETLTLFRDLGAPLQHTFSLPTNGNRQRYRAVEFTVPLRNVRSSSP